MTREQRKEEQRQRDNDLVQLVDFHMAGRAATRENRQRLAYRLGRPYAEIMREYRAAAKRLAAE